MFQEYKFLYQNPKNSKPFESSKKRPNLEKKTLPKSNNHENNQKKEGKKNEGNLPKPLPSFSFFRPLLSLFPATIYIEIKNIK